MFYSPHRRFNPLTGEWVLVSPHRAKRPWLGQVEKSSRRICHPMIPLAISVREMSAPGSANPDYSGTFSFDNDFAALCLIPLMR